MSYLGNTDHAPSTETPDHIESIPRCNTIRAQEPFGDELMWLREDLIVVEDQPTSSESTLLECWNTNHILTVTVEPPGMTRP